MEHCSNCGKPIDESNSCKCHDDTCCYCCDCEKGCSCNCALIAKEL